MSHPDLGSQEAYPLNPPLDNQKMSRRILLQRITGLVLMGSSLSSLDLACNSTFNITPARQSPISSAPGTTIYTYHGHSSSVEAVRWSPDGKQIASGSDDYTAQVWDAMTGGHVLIYRGHTDVVETVAWSPDGKHIASGGADTTAMVWQAP